MKQLAAISLLILANIIQGCAGTSINKLGKSDIDLVTDIHINSINKYIQQLTIKLYELNPAELKKNSTKDLEKLLIQIIEYPTSIAYKEVNYLKAVGAIELALSHSYKGDRVFALMVGISGMLRFSYNDQSELYILDQLDPQKLYDSGINLERIMQRIRITLEDNKPLMNFGSRHGKNSFEDITTRMASIQQMMAEILTEKNDRIINKVLHGTATILIPVPL